MLFISSPFIYPLANRGLTMIEFISSILTGEAGPIEYSLITALVSVTAFAALTG